MLHFKKYQSRFLNDNSRFKLLLCGRRFGKTQLMKGEAYKRLTVPNINGIYVAPTNTQAKQVFWKTFIHDIPSSYIHKIYQTDPFTIELINNSSLKIYGADAHDRMRGNGYNFALVDEIQDIKEEALYESIYPSLSDNEGDLIIAGTPKGRNNLGYKLFTDTKFSVYHYTTLQGGWVSKNEITLAKQMLTEFSFRQEYEASFEISGNLVYYQFSKDNLTDIDFNPNAETFLCWDFNVNPMSCIIVQRYSDDKLIAVKEYVLNNSNTYDTCLAVDSFLQCSNFNGLLWITGDRAGHNHSTQATASKTDYQIIESVFKSYKGYVNTRTTRTPTIKDRTEALNALFKNANGEIRLKINESECPKLIKDFNMVEWNESSFSLNATNKELTHASDALSYLALNFYPIHRRLPTVI